MVVVRPGILTGTGIPTVNKKKICIFGDEKKVALHKCGMNQLITSISLYFK
ncbi:hypothetical protein [Nostoc sp. 'Lobaria pulmonaria (5183) cyanobiont']|uniref:hypothetical protein n=1 Tax=Nostoc sp. 'Lobaria pulmonaria (5183) cyanobiont' TaxID=1618022 RepID=UPI002D7913D8|nr:hypothetical protein [Nostoc sp. 'Lobaria pulmonaria (5183) cyanobiont']